MVKLYQAVCLIKLFFFCNLQKSPPHLQQSRPMEQHNGQHKRKLKSHPPAPKMSRSVFFVARGAATSTFVCAAHCAAQWGDFFANGATSPNQMGLVLPFVLLNGATFQQIWGDFHKLLVVDSLLALQRRYLSVGLTCLP